MVWIVLGSTISNLLSPHEAKLILKYLKQVTKHMNPTLYPFWKAHGILRRMFIEDSWAQMEETAKTWELRIRQNCFTLSGHIIDFCKEKKKA